MSKKKIIIFGNGDKAKVVESEISKLKGFSTIYKTNSIKDIINFNEKIDNNTYGIVAIGLNHKREEIVKTIKKYIPKLKWTSIISKDALVADKIKIGEGTIIISGTIINPGTVIGNHCSINTGSIIEHDNCLEDFSSTGPGVVTGGHVSIGKRSYLGIGCIIKNNIIIKSDCVIGAQSYVNKNTNKSEVLFGVPAKKI